MILLSFDVETTGVDVNNDRVIEVGAILYSTGQHKALESAGYLVKTDIQIPPEVTALTGIHPAACERFGYDSGSALDNVLVLAEMADAIVGQNIVRFDKRVLENWCKREKRQLPEKFYIDTMTDLPGFEGRKLTLMAAEAPVKPFLNLFPHSALADCQTVLTLLEQFDLEKVIERAKSPSVVLQSHQARNENDVVKKARFRWSPLHRIWWKNVKNIDIPTLQYPFEVSQCQIPLEDLWTD